MKARTVAVTTLVLVAALALLAATAVAKNIKLTGVVKTVAPKPKGFGICGGTKVALLKGKNHVGFFNFSHCDSPGLTLQYRGTGKLTVGKITGDVVVDFTCAGQPIYGTGTVRKSNKSTRVENFSVGHCLPTTVGARFKLVLTP